MPDSIPFAQLLPGAQGIGVAAKTSFGSGTDTLNSTDLVVSLTKRNSVLCNTSSMAFVGSSPELKPIKEKRLPFLPLRVPLIF